VRRLLIQRLSIAAGQSRHVGRMESCCCRGRFQDLRLQVACTLLQIDHIIVNDSNKCCWFECLFVLERAQIKHFIEQEFSGIFSLAGGGGNLRFQNGNSKWPWHVIHGTEPFRSWTNSLSGVNRPIGHWPIRSLELSLLSFPGTFAPLMCIVRYLYKYRRFHVKFLNRPKRFKLVISVNRFLHVIIGFV